MESTERLEQNFSLWQPTTSRNNNRWGAGYVAKSAYRDKAPRSASLSKREQNAWDFLHTLRHPECMVQRYRLGESLADIAQGYNNVSAMMLERFLVLKFGKNWRVGKCKR